MLEIKPVDQAFYQNRIKDFLPEKMIDIHTHVWLDKFIKKEKEGPTRMVSWPELVAKENPVEDLIENYQRMFPGKRVTPMMFSNLSPGDDFQAANSYVETCSKKYGYPALLFADPRWSAEKLEEDIINGGFLGCKVYLNMAEPYIPEKEIRIFDFLPHHQLEVLNKHGWIVMLHIPRDGRLKDPVNLAQLLEVEKRYPMTRVIVAHVGRCYCPEDLGNAFEALAETRNMLFDFSANSNQFVFEQLIKAVGPKRILFGSDMPILRMRTRRICENGNYVNLVPEGLYGDVSGDSHMREVRGETAEAITFFMYEEIDAFQRAAEATGLGKKDIEDIFYNNGMKLIEDVSRA